MSKAEHFHADKIGAVDKTTNTAKSAHSANSTEHKNLTASEGMIIDSLKRQPNNLDGVFHELSKLRSSENPEQFKKDLAQINEDLHKQKVLPKLDLVIDNEKREGFSLKPVKSESSPDKAAKEKSGAKGADADGAKGSDQPAPGKPPESKPEQGHHRGHEQHHGGHERQHGAHHGGHGHHRGHGHHGRHGHHGHQGHRKGHGAHGGSGKFEDGAYDNVKTPDSATLENSVKTVLNEAKKQGLSQDATRAAVASMLVESKGNPEAVGDKGTSFGLFQLHNHGELTEGVKSGVLRNQTGAGAEKIAGQKDAFDPAKNAEVALTHFKALENHYHDPGKLAAEAQNPKYHGQYADKVNNLIAQADELIKKYSGS